MKLFAIFFALYVTLFSTRNITLPVMSENQDTYFTGESVVAFQKWYVDADATGANNGTSWTNAFTSFQSAISAAAADDSIFVATGIYKPSVAADGASADPRDRAFVLPANRKIYGGFAGTESSLAERVLNPATPSVLSGDIGTINNNTDNCYHVLIASGVTGTVLDGFTVTRGNANGAGTLTVGGNSILRTQAGALNISSSSPVIGNCIFTSNNASNLGGAIFSAGAAAITLTLTNCAFNLNVAGASGGAINNNSNSSAVISNCSFTNNTGTFGGAIISNNTNGIPASFTNLTVTGCTFTDNTANNDAGAISNNVRSHASISNSVFTSNQATGQGGAIASFSSGVDVTLTVSDCDFLENTSGTSGGAINNNSRSNATITNCDFTDNAGTFGGGIHSVSSASPITLYVTGCTFSSNSATTGGGGAINNNNNSSGNVTNCSFTGNSCATDGGAVASFSSGSAITITLDNCTFLNNAAGSNGGAVNNLTLSSANINNCTFTGNSASSSTGGGGAVYSISNSGSTTLTIDSSGFTSNTATNGNGGAINKNNRSTASITHSTFTNNTAGGTLGGGGIYSISVSGAATTQIISNCSFTSNSATNTSADGGAINSREYSSYSIDSSTFSGNNAAYGAGIISFGGSGSPVTLVVTNSDFMNNVATIDGGAINNNTNSSATITGCNFTGNAADNGAGIACTSGGSITITTCDFTGNTATGGAAAGGGLATNSNASITDCLFSNNSSNSGGAIFSSQSSGPITLTVINCDFSENSASNGGAITTAGSSSNTSILGSTFTANSSANSGGIRSSVNTLTVDNCDFEANSVAGIAGAIYNNSILANISNCNFNANVAGGEGGAIVSFASGANISLSVTGCSFTGNTAGGGNGGGAINNNDRSSATITRCSFFGNTTTAAGGGIYSASNIATTLTITNCVLANNSSGSAAAAHSGGITNSSNSTATIINSTFYNNTASNHADGGGGICNRNNGSATIVNSIFWGNQGGSNVGNAGINNQGTGTVTATYCNVQGGFPGTGNIGVAPIFVNPAANNLRLQSCSPAINAGNNAGVPGGVTTDLDGNPRIQLTTVDMGAYESAVETNINMLASAYTAVNFVQDPNDSTIYATACDSLISIVAGDGTATSISGNTSAKVWIESTQPANFVKRHYEITPQNNAATATGIVTLYFRQQEFDDFNAVNVLDLPAGEGDAAGKARLRIDKRSGISNNGTGLPGTYTGTASTIDPDDDSIVWNNTDLRWEVSLAVTGFSGFFVKTQEAGLPVQLITFTAKKQSTGVLLQWTTENEINNSHFDIQRSADGRNYFNIGRINASLFPGNRMNYSFPDLQPATGINFYRLKQVDLDADFQYSPVRRIDFGAAAGGLLVYPNPAVDFIQFEFNSNAKKVWVNIYDAKGKRIMQQELNHQPVIKIPVHPLAAGIYYVQVSDGNNSSTGKFIISF